MPVWKIFLQRALAWRSSDIAISCQGLWFWWLFDQFVKWKGKVFSKSDNKFKILQSTPDQRPSKTSPLPKILRNLVCQNGQCWRGAARHPAWLQDAVGELCSQVCHRAPEGGLQVQFWKEFKIAIFNILCSASCLSTRPTGTTWWRSSSAGSRMNQSTRINFRQAVFLASFGFVWFVCL